MLLYKHKHYYLGEEVEIKQELKEFSLVVVQVVKSSSTITIDATTLKTTATCNWQANCNMLLSKSAQR